jgi:hypothetical protein
MEYVKQCMDMRVATPAIRHERKELGCGALTGGQGRADAGGQLAGSWSGAVRHDRFGGALELLRHASAMRRQDVIGNQRTAK